MNTKKVPWWKDTDIIIAGCLGGIVTGSLSEGCYLVASIAVVALIVLIVKVGE